MTPERRALIERLIREDAGTLPLHHAALVEGDWWACQHPERPGGHADAKAAYDIRCRACCIAFEASLRIDGDRVITHIPSRILLPMSEVFEVAADIGALA